MIGVDFSKFADANFSHWSWRRLGGAFVLCLFSIILIDQLAPRQAWKSRVGVQRQEGTVSEQVILRWRDRRDPRGFTTPEEIGFSSDRFGLAWLSGSTISIRSDGPEHNFRGRFSYELTDVFAAQYEAINGKDLWVHEYMIQGARTGDMRRAVLHAAHDPAIDAIVIALNPVWLFNDWAIYTKSNQRASIVSMKGAYLSDWLAALKYNRPSSLLGALTSRYFRFVRDRYPNSRRLPRIFGVGFPLTKKTEPPDMQYVNARELFPNYVFQAPSSMKKYQKHRSQMLRQTVETNGESAKFFARMLRTLKSSNKPVLLYVAPLPEGIQGDPEGLEFLKHWIEKVKNFASIYGGPNIVLHTDSIYGVQGEIVHRDIAHLHYGQGVVDEVAGLLESDLGLTLERREASDLYGNAASENHAKD